ncbi:GGDEF domain-containing protein [soil metagenome]
MMKSRAFLRLIYVLLFLLEMGFVFPASVMAMTDVDKLLELTTQYLHTNSEKSIETFAQLTKLQPTFTKKQKELYSLIYAGSLGFKSKNKERVAFVESFIQDITEPNLRVKFLYQLSDGYSNLGEYEKALGALNQSIILLPNLIDLGAKITTLQSAITILDSVYAYDEAMLYAERLTALEAGTNSFLPKCYGLANQVEINFLRKNSKDVQLLVPDAIKACDSAKHKFVANIIKSLAIIELINSGDAEMGIKSGLPLLDEFSKLNPSSDYVTQLEEGIARAFLKKGELERAEKYGLLAYQRAKTESSVLLIEKTSETMAAIKRHQGQLNSALEYYDINLALKKKVLDDQLQKNLAYQRVKFDTQDKANQLTLLEQKNKILNVEKKLAQRNKESLLLLITLAVILLTILVAWLLRTLQQKNIFRTSSQIDGLTRVSNRSHFMTCAASLFHKLNKPVSVVLFDMDFFKKINDTFGHAAGDWVLKTVCETVKSQLGKTAQAGILGRLGGEEFGICLSDISEAEALAMAERCRIAVADIDTSACGYRFPISASFGIASRGQQGLQGFEDTLAAADKALYFSKSEGRNRVSVYQ